MRGRIFGCLLFLVVAVLAAAGCGGGQTGSGGDAGSGGGAQTGAGGETSVVEETSAGEGAGGGAGTVGETESAAAAGSQAGTIQMTEFAFDPADVTLDGAGTYVFDAENSGDAPHALEIEGNGVEAATDVVPPGQSAELRVDLEPGTYRMYCPVGNHEALGMVGTLTVS